MMIGDVTEDREIVIVLEGMVTDETLCPIKAVVDTGFNGYLTLPLNVLDELGSTEFGTRRAELGDGNLVEMEVHLVTIQWHSEKREVLALRAEAAPLVGMALLWGSQVSFDAREGGSISVEEIAPHDKV